MQSDEHDDIAELLTQPVLTPPEVARVLRIGRSAAYELARSGEIPTLRLSGRCVRIPTARFLVEVLGVQPAPQGGPPASAVAEVLPIDGGVA